jgi:hypothetical protein
VVTTAEFFTPVVDDAYDFGRIAAANALSDIYVVASCQERRSRRRPEGVRAAPLLRLGRWRR